MTIPKKTIIININFSPHFRPDTLEMRYAEMTNKTPFAVLHFDDHHPSLVQIVQENDHSILKPIKKQDLSYFSIGGDAQQHRPAPSQSMDSEPLDSKRIVITIVASIHQSFVNGEFSAFTIKSPEVVRYVKLLVDDEDYYGEAGGTTLASPHELKSSSRTHCVPNEELDAIKNSITIATSFDAGSRY